MSSKKIKWILSFIIGFVLSFITVLLLTYVSFLWLLIGILLWVGIGMAVYMITLNLSHSNGISGLCAVIGGGIGMWIVSGLLGKYLEVVQLAEGPGIFLSLLPIALVWTVIVYFIADAADNK